MPESLLKDELYQTMLEYTIKSAEFEVIFGGCFLIFCMLVVAAGIYIYKNASELSAWNLISALMVVFGFLFCLLGIVVIGEGLYCIHFAEYKAIGEVNNIRIMGDIHARQD